MTERAVKLFRNGRNQAVRIPREFELPGSEAVMRREGEQLILQAKPAHPNAKLVALLKTLKPLEEDFPEIPDYPLKPVHL